MAFYNRGIFWFVKKQYDNALADNNEAIRLDPKMAMAHCNRGSTWYAKKEYRQALTDYNEAIRLNSSDALVYSNRAWLWATCPDPTCRDAWMAIESATRGCDLSQWKKAYHIGTLAAAYAEAGNFDKAVEYQEKANMLYTDAEDRKKGEDRLRLYKDKKPYRDER